MFIFAATHFQCSLLPSFSTLSFLLPSTLYLWAFSLLFIPLSLSSFSPLFSPDFSVCVFQHRQHLHRHADRLKKRPNKSLFPANIAIFRKKKGWKNVLWTLLLDGEHLHLGLLFAPLDWRQMYLLCEPLNLMHMKQTLFSQCCIYIQGNNVRFVLTLKIKCTYALTFHHFVNHQ